MENSIRKLVSVQTIRDIIPANNADALEIAIINNWNVVVKKNVFTPGQKVLFFEIDSMIPFKDKRFGLPENQEKNAKTVNGEKFHVLKTVKLRGNISQGLIAPLDDFINDGMELEEGVDLSEKLGVLKKEDNVDSKISSGVSGKFDTRLARKSDSERIQNLFDHWDTIKSHDWIATEKIDGSSLTIAKDYDGKIRLFSRNNEIFAEDHPIFNILGSDFFNNLEKGTAVQGEIFGNKIQSNRLGINGVDFRAFSMFRNGNLVSVSEWPDFVNDIRVPVLDVELPDTIDELISMVDGMKSTISPDRLAEGIVFHEKNGKTFKFLSDRSNFKVISNKFLLKEK